jgi:pyruvate/2-oxoglutarate dehydrogenase complex dihydrolipoamide dehydrogenase (E3) component
MFRRFGSQVTIVQRGPRLLAREDADVADAVADILRADGISVLLSAEAVRVEGQVELTVRTADGERTLHGSHLLVAVGRQPNTDTLNLPATGLGVDKHGYIPANPRLETKVSGIYALGDVKGGPAFTHISYDDWRIIRTNLLDNGQASTTGRLVPYTVFIDPQLGRIGLTEEEALASGCSIQVATMPMADVARALEVDESRGFLKAIVDTQTGQVLGGAILGIEGGELMAMLEIAMLGKLSYTVLREAIFAHPTLAEAFNNLFTRLSSPRRQAA